MPHFLVFVSYSQKAWEVLVRNPQNRMELVRPTIEGLGGKLEAAFLSLANYEVVAIILMPTNIDIAALSMAFMSQFAVKAVKTIPLLTWAEGVEAMVKAKKAAYKPPESNPMITRNE